jgi:hypothetical protein
MGNAPMLNGWRQFTSEHDSYGDINHGDNFLEERSQERTARTNTNVFRADPGCLTGGERASGRLGKLSTRS